MLEMIYRVAKTRMATLQASFVSQLAFCSLSYWTTLAIPVCISMTVELSMAGFNLKGLQMGSNTKPILSNNSIWSRIVEFCKLGQSLWVLYIIKRKKKHIPYGKNHPIFSLSLIHATFFFSTKVFPSFPSAVPMGNINYKSSFPCLFSPLENDWLFYLILLFHIEAQLQKCN
jgi:hypothetical protein